MGPVFALSIAKQKSSPYASTPVTRLLQTCVVSSHCTIIKQQVPKVYNHVKSYSQPSPVIPGAPCISVVQRKLNTCHQCEIRLYNQYHCKPVVSKLWASAQLWAFQHFLLSRTECIVVGSGVTVGGAGLRNSPIES